MLTVFLNNKLISCDTILPLAMEVHQRTKKPVKFVTLNEPTYQAITENVVLWNAIHEIGSLSLLGSSKKSLTQKIKNRIHALSVLTPQMLKASIGSTKFIHFRALNRKPLRPLAAVAGSSAFFCESSSYGETQEMRQVVELQGNVSPDTHAPTTGSIVAFQPGWRWLSDPRTKHLPKYVFGATRQRKVWLDYIRRVSDAHHHALLDNLHNARHDETIVYMLGYLGPLPYLRSENTTVSLMTETLTSLAKVADGRAIVIKPHVITDRTLLDQAVHDVRQQYPSIVVSSLHPMVLAARAQFFISNYYSTTLSDAWSVGVPTIEYTHYSDAALSVTNGHSMRREHISHFIQRDPVALDECMRNLLNRPRAPMPTGTVDDPSGLLERLST